jgi:hypothetical protein
MNLKKNHFMIRFAITINFIIDEGDMNERKKNEMDFLWFITASDDRAKKKFKALV